MKTSKTTTTALTTTTTFKNDNRQKMQMIWFRHDVVVSVVISVELTSQLASNGAVSRCQSSVTPTLLSVDSN